MDLDGRRVGRVTGGDGRRTDGGKTTIVINRRVAATTGTRGAPGGAESLWCEMWGNAIESRRFTHDNWNYRAQKSVPRQIDGGRGYHVVIRIRDHFLS